jgi:hypothetical protein
MMRWWLAVVAGLGCAGLGCAGLGCAVPHGTGADDEGNGAAAKSAASTTPTITFNADWTVKVEGTLRAGGKVDVTYDLNRLTTCRGTQDGKPQWALSAVWDLGSAHGSATVGGLMAPAEPKFTIDLPTSGDLSLYFQNNNRWGCNAYGSNYHFNVLPPENAPGWMGNVASVISRATCDGKGCDSDRHELEGFSFDTWARQRAAIAAAYFDVWKEGVTDWDNPDLWKQLDVQVHYRFAGTSAWATAYVPFERRVNHDARYAAPLRAIDPLRGNTRTKKDECPAGALTKSADGQYVQLGVELYFTVNGVELRPAAGGAWHGTFSDYAGLYTPCFP